ncbi:hypothetical protein [Brevibacillus sp. NRS-1366]|uniref:hypothetical protein n=1 Tax=Brevibacillus sp. NRS-1366 TaxID=3233899 RepID=UPI003D1DAD63
MIKYFLLILLGIILLVLSQVKNQRVFRKDIYQIYKDLKKELMFMGVTGDQYDNAKDFLRSQRIQDRDLEKLQTLITIHTTNSNLITQIGTISATVAITIITLLFGILSTAVLGGLYSKYAEMYIESADSKKIDNLFSEMDKMVEIIGDEFIIIAWLLLGGIAIWKLCSIDTNQTNVVLQKIVSDEIQDRKNSKEQFNAPN